MSKQHSNNKQNKPEIKTNQSYALYIKNELYAGSKKLPDDIEKTEPLAFLDYEAELKLKFNCLKSFLTDYNIMTVPEKIIKSPLPRYYRTTSKRKVHESRDKFYFLFADESYPTRPDLFRQSLLEPDAHKKIFEFLCSMFNSAGFTFLARTMNFIIVRGSYTEFSVIFNISKINADVVNKLKQVSEKLRQTGVNIVSVFTYYDPTKSEYYFESERPEKEVTFKKFFGSENLFLKLNEKKFSYHPTSFSQINESIIPLFVEKAGQLIEPHNDEHFYDLYCGYGLFACSFAGMYKETIGIEAAGESVNSAATNAKYLAKNSKIRFIAKRITEESLEKCLPLKIRENEVFLLDPPRNGTEKGVINVIAERNPAKVLHIFCNVDEIPKGVGEWEKCGYKLISLSPLDLFPGSPNLEVMALFRK